MQCAQCHHDVPDGSLFCPQCGSPLADRQGAFAATPSEAPPPETQPADATTDATDAAPSAAQAETPQDEFAAPEPVPSTAQAEPPADKPEYRSAGAVAPEPLVSPPPAPEKKRKRHGCLIAFGIFLLLIGIALVVLFDLPMRLGLVSSPAEKMFTGQADRQAEAVLARDFEEARQPTQGISFVVLPYWGRGYSLAYVVLDASKGYRYVDTGFEDPIFAAFQIVARSKAVQQAQIYRVAVEFREADGVTLSVLTAPVFAIQQYAAKQIDRKQFIAKMDGHANLMRMYKDQYSWLGGPL